MKINQFADSLNGVANQVPAGNKPSATRTRGNDASAAASVNGNARLPTDVNSLATQVRQLQSQLIQPGNGDFNAALLSDLDQQIRDGDVLKFDFKTRRGILHGGRHCRRRVFGR